DGIALYMREAADQRAAVQRLEFVEHRTVDEAGDYLADVERLLGIGGDDAIQLLAIEQRRNRCATVHFTTLAPVEVGDAAASQRKGVLIILGVVVGHAGG